MRRLITAAVLAVIAALGATAFTPPPRAQADAAVIHYLYDDLDRLFGVVDQQGNVATYSYDPVGNLRRIDRVEAAAMPGAVAITLVTPNQGVVDTVVRIFGKGFSSSPALNTVTFNGTPATVSSAASNVLVTRVPPAAMTGPITVQTALGSAASPTPFRVIGVLAITPPGAVLLVGTSRQFTASDSGNPDTAFSWSVNGVAGGNADIGTVTSAGLYTAPASVPTPAAVTLTATATDDTRLSVSVPILIASEPHFALQLATPVSVGVVPAAATTPVPATATAPPVALAMTIEPPPPGPTPAAGFAAPVSALVAPPAGAPDPVPAVSVAAPVGIQLAPPATSPEPTFAVGVAPPVAIRVSPADATTPTPAISAALPIAVGIAAPEGPPPPVPATIPAGPVAVEIATPPLSPGSVAQPYGVVALAVAPVITAVTPASTPPGVASLVVTLTGEGLAGATAVTFLRADGADSAITVDEVVADADGTRAVVTITVATHAVPGPRVVQVTTPTGAAGATRTSTPVAVGGNVFTVQ